MNLSSAPVRLLCVVGARPNFMKIAPLIRAFAAEAGLSASLVHTGQHYDAAMKAAFFTQLGIPEPDVDLGVGSGSHAVQTAEVMRRFEPVLEQARPDAVIVVGDVNSTLACALVAVKREVPVIHVEAGLRSYDRRMPEEINRVLTDQISALLYTTERRATEQLVREGIAPERVHFVGNVMIDTLREHQARAPTPPAVLERLGIRPALAQSVTEPHPGYGLVTLHRPSNVDEPDTLHALMTTLGRVAERLPLVFPLHPRTRDRLERSGLYAMADGRFILLPPLGYLDMLALMGGARLVMTDSGGVQEETTALGVPCLTLREQTERPVTVEFGTNTVVGTSQPRVLEAVLDVLTTGGKRGRLPELWDGAAAPRIAAHVLAHFRSGLIRNWQDSRPPGGLEP